MGELLHLRLGALAVMAAFAAVGLPILARTLFVLERSGRIPVTTNPSRRSLRTDLGYLLLSPLTEVFSRTLGTLAIAALALLAGEHVGPDLLRGFGPAVKQPRWLIVSEMLVLSDFIYYWTHRLAHTNPVLWRLHAVHHSTRHLRWTSAMRAHPAEVYLHLVTVVPLFLLGFPVDAAAPLAPLITLYAFVIHTNVNWSVRRLSYVVNSPRYHGWHHALDAKDGGVNFAGLFPLFDALFGTYLLPDHRPRDVGIDDAEMPGTCLAQLEYPFRRHQKESRPNLDADLLDDREPATLEARVRPSGVYSRRDRPDLYAETTGAKSALM